MADKQLQRPSGLIPSWANDENIDDPGELWDATPTKVEPGAGLRDDGLLPDEDVAAQHLNSLWNGMGQWIQHFSDIQLNNWPHTSVIAITDGIITPGQSCCFDEGTNAWFIGAEASANVRCGVYYSQSGGDNWETNFTLGIAEDMPHIFSKPDTDAPTHSGGYIIGTDADACIIRTGGLGVPTFTSYALAGVSADANCGVWDPSNQLILVAGDITGPVPEIWTSPAAAPAFTARGPTTTNSTTIVDMATDGAGLSLAIGDAANGDTWTSTDGTNWTQRPTTISNMVACAYNPEEGMWMIATSTGLIYTSVDAIAWTNVGSLGTAGARIRSLKGHGSQWVICEDGGSKAVFYSTNSGVTWRPIWPTVGDEQGARPNMLGVGYSRRRDQFMLVAGDAVSMSMSMGTTPLRASTGTESPPAVT